MDQLAQEYPLKVTYMSYYLRPDIPPEGHIRKLKAGEKAGDPLTGHISNVADAAGLIMRRARITPNTRMAFEASEYAKDMGCFEDFHRACYRALWEDGLDLGQLSVLQQLGEKVGLDSQEMQSVLDTGQYTAQTKKQYEDAISMGINGIPSFIIDGYFFSGAQPYETFKRVVEIMKDYKRSRLA